MEDEKIIQDSITKAVEEKEIEVSVEEHHSISDLTNAAANNEEIKEEKHILHEIETPPKESKEYRKEMRDRFDYAFGAVIGAFIGDALGANLEFKTEFIPKILINQIMDLEEMFGTHGTASGQITDDSELAMCLAHGLARGQGKLNVSEITRFYAKWLHQSMPFDVGHTIYSAFTYADVNKPEGPYVQRMAAMYNQESESNGALILTSLEDISRAVIEDVSLTHTNKNVHTACIAYCLAVRCLINTKGNRQIAYQEAFNYIKESGNVDLQEWFEDIENNKEIGCHTQMGWIKKGFHYAFLHLKNNSTFDYAIRDILAHGGDTDTNAAIVGGMIGTAIGFKDLPQNLKICCLNVDTTKVGIRRPRWLVPKFHIKRLIHEIFNNAPEHLEVDYEALDIPTNQYLDGIN